MATRTRKNVVDDTSDSVNALAALERLTTLFADVPFSNLEAHLSDPSLALENVELDDLLLHRHDCSWT